MEATGTGSRRLAKCLVASVAVLCMIRAEGSGRVREGETTDQQKMAASWIAALPDTTGTGPLPIFRREFGIPERVRKATLRISGLGQYEVHLNGRQVTDAVMNPAWSDYRKRIYYNTYDVTQLVRLGKNAVGVLLGNGMYNVVETRGRYTKFSGSWGQPKLVAELDVEFADGKELSIRSDGDWKTTPGPITFDSIYGGEDFDARREQDGWDRPGFDDAKWERVTVVQGPGGTLEPQRIPPIRPFDRYEPLRVTHPKPGIAVYDLGQNFAGWPEIKVMGDSGSSVTMIAGELLDDKGLVSQRSAYAFPDSRNAFTYVLKGGAPERWHPVFSYYGFRYIQVEIAGQAHVDHLSGNAIHDAAKVDGHFSSSDELFSQIHKLIDRAMLSNMMSVLTDCRTGRNWAGWNRRISPHRQL